MRLALGDQEWVPLTPDEPGFGNYGLFSDDELQALLDIAGGNVPRAIAIAYQKIGASWASTGATIKTDDLSYSAKESVGNWLTLAKFWNDLADRQEEVAMDSYFDLVEVGTVRKFHATPEASPFRIDTW